MQKITVLSAVASNLVIGNRNALPWLDNEELRFFKNYTMGKVLIVGTKTFLSMPKSVWNTRTPVILTKGASHADKAQLFYTEHKFPIAHSLTDALEIAEHLSKGNEIIIAGGASVYKEALNGDYPVTHLVISEMSNPYAGDTHFPGIGVNLDCLGVLHKGENFTTFVYRVGDVQSHIESYSHHSPMYLSGYEGIDRFLMEMPDNLNQNVEFLAEVCTALGPNRVHYSDGVLDYVAGTDIPSAIEQTHKAATYIRNTLNAEVYFQVEFNGDAVHFDGVFNPLARWRMQQQDSRRLYLASAAYRVDAAKRRAIREGAQRVTDVNMKAADLFLNSARTSISAQRAWIVSFLEAYFAGAKPDIAKTVSLLEHWGYSSDLQAVGSNTLRLEAVATHILVDLKAGRGLHPILQHWIKDIDMKYKLAFPQVPEHFGLGASARRESFSKNESGEPQYLWVVGVIADQLSPEIEGSACVVLASEGDDNYIIKRFNANSAQHCEPEKLVDAIREFEAVFVRL